MMFTAIAFVGAFLLTAALGFVLIPVLKKLNFGQTILEIGPKWHMHKQGTPTMGGFMFIIGITIVTLALTWKSMAEGDFSAVAVLAFAYVSAGIGFVDDFFKVRNKRNMGLTVLQKLLLQVSVSAAFLAALRGLGYMTPNVHIPFINISVPLPWIVFLTLALIYSVGMLNAIQITDGIDGHLSSATLPVAVFFALLVYVRGAALGDMPVGAAVLSAAFAGALIGFLVHNFNPAKVFMGDTGSLFIAGLVCGLAFVFDVPLILIPVGVIYVIELFSDVIQVLYYKASGGKRVFRMAPIHHHFEMGGWSEKKLCGMSFSITLFMCALTAISLMWWYSF